MNAGLKSPAFIENQNFSIFALMKILSVIMSVIILALSFVPCADNNSVNQSQEISLHQDSDNHQHHSDFCSPLCVCSCCGTIVAQIEGQADFEIKTYEIYSSQENLLKPRFPSDISFSIWEPPKII